MSGKNITGAVIGAAASLVAGDLCIGSSAALAQTAQQSQAGETKNEIVVVGVRGSLQSAAAQKRASSEFRDVLVAEDIGKFPDLNITEALQRVPGVSIYRTSGEGKNITLRGLPPEFTQTLVNGQPIPGGGSRDAAPGGREVDLDIFASELIQRVDLIKSPSAELPDGGLSATVNLVTRRPLDEKGLIYAASLQGQQNSQVGGDNWDPRASLIVSNNWGSKFGALLAVAHSDTQLRQDSADVIFWRLDTAWAPGIETPFLPRNTIEQRDRKRTSVNGALQFRPSEDLEFVLDLNYSNFDENLQRNNVDAFLNLADVRPLSPIYANGLNGRRRIIGGTFGNVRSRLEGRDKTAVDELFTVNLDTKWRMGGGWSAAGKIGYSEDTQDDDQIDVIHGRNGTLDFSFANYRGEQVPIFALREFGYTRASDPWEFEFFRLLYTDTTDKTSTARIDLIKEFEGRAVSSFKSGLWWSSRKYERNQRLTQWNPAQAAAVIAANPAARLPSFGSVARPAPLLFNGNGPAGLQSQYLTNNVKAFATRQTLVSFPAYSPPFNPNASSEVSEDVVSGYVQADFDTTWSNRRVRGNIGVRVARTETEALAYVTTSGVFKPVVDSGSYTDVMPSLNVAVDIADNTLVRIAASRAIARPNLFDLPPALSAVRLDQRTVTRGNPKLEPFRVNQVDVGLEHYFSDGGFISATAFYKSVESFVTQAVTTGPVNFGQPVFGGDNTTDLNNSVNFTIRRPINGEGQNFPGIELSYQQPLDRWLPVDGFGVVANYTYAKSERVPQLTYGGAKYTTGYRLTSENSFNAVAYYENRALSARLAYSWRDDFMYEESGDAVSPWQIQGYGQLDFSGSFSLNKNMSLTLDAINLTNELRQSFGVTADQPRTTDETGRYILVGVRFKN